MVAHLHDIVSDCDWSGCTHRAVVILHNHYDALIGRYCHPHGEQRLKSARAGDRKAKAS